MADEAPYKLSRSALRKRYGSRAITSGGQSSRDYTPSGRAKYLAEESARTGLTPQQIAAPRKELLQAQQQVANEFRAGFGPQEMITPIAANIPPVGAPQLPQRQFMQGGIASPEDVQTLIQQGATGTVRGPGGMIQLPPTPSAEQLSEFMPASVSPLGSFGLPKPKSPYMGGILAGANKWRMPV